MLIGILSDTHGLLRQEVIDGFKGVDHMHFEKEYPDEANEITHVSVIHRPAT